MDKKLNKKEEDIIVTGNTVIDSLLYSVDRVKSNFDDPEIIQKYNIENRQTYKVFSIDPEGCTDIDDAFSIIKQNDNYLISIYISNVPIILDSKGIRKLTPRECFNLQGFPKEYNLPSISDGNLYKIAGNAVSVPVVKLIANRLISIIN